MDKIAGRDCRDCTGCRPEIPRLQGLLGLPNFQSEIAESHDQDCWDCDGDCRPILQRLQRLLGVPRMQIFPGLPRLPRLSPEIDGITDIAGRGWVITCWDWKNFLSCRTGLPGLHRLPPKNTEIARVAGIDENAEFADRDCQDCDGDCRPTCQTLARLPGFPRMQIMARLSRSPRLWAKIAGLPILSAESGWLHSEIEKII